MNTFHAPNGCRYESHLRITDGSYGVVHKCTVVNEDETTLPGHVAVKALVWGHGGCTKSTVLRERDTLNALGSHDGIV